MQGFFTAPDKLVVNDVPRDVSIACALPAFYLHTMLYEFAVSEKKEEAAPTYLNQFIAWSPRPFCVELARTLFRGNSRVAIHLNNPYAKRADFGPIVSQQPEVVAWRDFDALELARELTGVWKVYTPEVVALLRAKDWPRLLPLMPLVPERVAAARGVSMADPLSADIALYYAVRELVHSAGPIVSARAFAEYTCLRFLYRSEALSTARLLDAGLLHMRGDTVTLPWVHALIARCPPVLVGYDATDAQVARKYPGHAKHPFGGPCDILVCPATVTVKQLLATGARPAQGIVVVGDPRVPFDLLEQDLPLARLTDKWLDRFYQAWAPPLLAPAAYPPKSARDKGIFAYNEPDTRARFNSLCSVLDPSRDKRVVVAFGYDDPIERARYESSAFARGPNFMCVDGPSARIPLYSVLTRHWTKKDGVFYKLRGATIPEFGDARVEPFAVCSAAMLSVLRPDDFDVVVLLGDLTTAERWVPEAMRVGARGLVVLCGVV